MIKCTVYRKMILAAVLLLVALTGCSRDNSLDVTPDGAAIPDTSASVTDEEESELPVSVATEEVLPEETILDSTPEIATEGKELEDPASFVETFSLYFFSGNTEDLEKCLAEDCQNPAVCYEGETAGDITVKTIAPIEDDNHLFASIQFIAGNEDSFSYLSMELINTEEGWKVLSYGVEK